MIVVLNKYSENLKKTYVFRNPTKHTLCCFSQPVKSHQWSFNTRTTVRCNSMCTNHGSMFDKVVGDKRRCLIRCAYEYSVLRQRLNKQIQLNIMGGNTDSWPILPKTLPIDQFRFYNSSFSNLLKRKKYCATKSVKNNEIFLLLIVKKQTIFELSSAKHDGEVLFT